MRWLVLVVASALICASCGGGGGGASDDVTPPVDLSSQLVVLMFMSGHELGGVNDSYLHLSDSLGPFIVEGIRAVHPNLEVRYYRDGEGSATAADGLEAGGTDQLVADLQLPEWRDARKCLIAHSHGGARAIAALRGLPEIMVDHVVLLDANAYAFAASGHDDSHADEEAIDARTAVFHQMPSVSSNSVGVLPANLGGALEFGHFLHHLEQQDLIPWNVRSCLEYRLAERVPAQEQDRGLDRHWNVRPNGSMHRLSPRLAPTDTHGSIHRPAVSGVPEEVLLWLRGELARPLSTGTFRSPVEHMLATPGASPVCCDVNNDGRSDVLMFVADGRLAVLKGVPGARLLSQPEYIDLGVSGDIIPCDADRDDLIDLLVVSESDASVRIHYGLGSGRFADPVFIFDQFHPPSLQFRVAPRACALADINGDDYLDVVAIGDSDEVLVAFGVGGTARQWTGQSHLGSLPDGDEFFSLSVTAEDLNADGVCDLLVGDQSFGGIGTRPQERRLLLVRGALEASGSTTFDLLGATQLLPSSLSEFTRPTQPLIADFNRDGHRDVLLDDDGSARPLLFLGNGQGGFAFSRRLDGGTRSLRVADLDGDAVLDTVEVGLSSQVRVRRSPFDQPVVDTYLNEFLPNSFDVLALEVGDFDGDGCLDVVGVGGASAVLYVLPGQ